MFWLRLRLFFCNVLVEAKAILVFFLCCCEPSLCCFHFLWFNSPTVSGTVVVFWLFGGWFCGLMGLVLTLRLVVLASQFGRLCGLDGLVIWLCWLCWLLGLVVCLPVIFSMSWSTLGSIELGRGWLVPQCLACLIIYLWIKHLRWWLSEGVTWPTNFGWIWLVSYDLITLVDNCAEGMNAS